MMPSNPDALSATYESIELPDPDRVLVIVRVGGDIVNRVLAPTFSLADYAHTAVSDENQ